MTLKCGMNRWTEAKAVKSGNGPTEEAAYQRATQEVTWLIWDIRYRLREECPPDCDGGRMLKWNVTLAVPYTWPGWKDGEPWWFSEVELSYDISVFCLSRAARDAAQVDPAPSPDTFLRLNPHAPAADADSRRCESVLLLAFDTDLQENFYGADTDEAQKGAKALVKARATKKLTDYALQFRCRHPCFPLLLFDNAEPDIIARSLEAPWFATGRIAPYATYVCMSSEGDTGRLVRERLTGGGFMTPEEARIFWPGD